MSYNLANLPVDERRAMEDEKSELFVYWQQNLDRAKGEAARILGEKDRRKGKWSNWAAEQIEALQPEQYRGWSEEKWGGRAETKSPAGAGHSGSTRSA